MYKGTKGINRISVGTAIHVPYWLVLFYVLPFYESFEAFNYFRTNINKMLCLAVVDIEIKYSG